MKFHHKLLLLHGVLVALAVIGLIVYWDPIWLLVFVAGKYVFANIGLEIGYHRLFAHRSFKTAQWKENLLAFIGLYGAFGPSLTWTANHRVHHKHSDRDGDPHPASEGWRTFFWANDKVPIAPTVVKDLLRNPVHKFIRNHYFKIWIITLIIGAVLIPKFTLYFLVLPGATGLLSAAAINILCHKIGYRNFETRDQSTNSILVNLYAMFGGSGWHNNHHANPGNWTTKVKWWETDLDGWVIKHCFMT
jgi:stearoyl-CoA desaturase (delta-9 desaturase)